jgi:ammonium transporter, Amt family
MAVALQNAQRFEEISQFNATLQERVKRATKELSLVNDKLQKLDLLKDEFITIASHDLRSPLATIKGFVWMAVKDIGKSSPKAKEHLDKALESTERSISLVSDMLDVSRIEAGRIELRPEKLNICQMGSEVAEELANIAKDKKIEVSTNCKGNAFVKVDKERIHRVLTNLIGNAIKFTPERGKVGISVIKNGKMAEVAITDSGIGIKKDDLPKLFTKFGKIETASKIPATTGTGLGLYISKNIIELSCGKIWVKSTPGKGSTFTFSLPIA